MAIGPGIRKLAIGSLAAFLAAAVLNPLACARKVSIPARAGELCEDDRGCAPGSVCMEHAMAEGSRREWRCQIPCDPLSTSPQLCPSGMLCALASPHGALRPHCGVVPPVLEVTDGGRGVRFREDAGGILLRVGQSDGGTEGVDPGPDSGIEMEHLRVRE
jgi:hypothetical protein